MYAPICVRLCACIFVSCVCTVRKHGAIPATIGIVEGECIVGMDEYDIRVLAKKGK